MTLTQLAKLAHVSVSTASKAFSGSPEVNSETRALIFETAKQHGCYKKFFNAKYPKYVIGVICPEFKSGYYSEAVSAISSVASENNCEISVAVTNFSKETILDLIDYYCNYSACDALIIIDSTFDIRLRASETPIATVSAHSFIKADIEITLDFTVGMQNVITDFERNGISTLGFIGESLTMHKANVFKETAEKFGYNENDIKIVLSDKRFEEGGYDAMNKILNGGNPPQAILCAYDCLAIGAMKCITDHGLKIPDDILVVGMDNIRKAPYLTPSLSSVDSGINKACSLAATALLNKLNGNPYEKSAVFKAVYVKRTSSIK